MPSPARRDHDQPSPEATQSRLRPEAKQPMSALHKGIALADGLLSVVGSKRRWGPFLETYKATDFDHAFSVSYAQAGEDLALGYLVGHDVGRYLDIGAHHPSRFSVTRRLYDSGWSGVNVDANPRLIRAFHRDRPRDVSLAAFVGVPDSNKSRPFYVFEEHAISTGDPDWRDKFLQEGNRLEQTIEVPVVSLAELMSKHFSNGAPTVLNVDCEGADEEVLRSGEWSTWRPRVVAVETSGSLHAAAASGGVQFLQSVGYQIHFVLPMATILTINEAG